jgi:hypothetical protein
MAVPVVAVTRRANWAAPALLSVAVLFSTVAGGAEASSITEQLTGMFRTYMRLVRATDPNPPLFPCEEDLRCLADFFSRRYLAGYAQETADSTRRGEPQTRDPLRYGLRIAKTYEYSAATTAPDRAVLTMVATDPKGTCLPLIRIHYRKELNAWRIDQFEEDSSDRQVCKGRAAVDTF